MSNSSVNTTLATTPCIILTLSVPLTSKSDGRAVKAAYTELRKKLADMAIAVAADPNVIVTHSQYLGEVETITDAQLKATFSSGGTADPTIAGLQTINKRIEKGHSAAVKPEYKSKFESAPEPSEEETPHITAMSMEEYKKLQASGQSETQGTTVEVEVVDVDEVGEKLHELIFTDMIRKTSKSLAIMKYLITNRDKVVNISDIASAAGLTNGDVSIWLSTTGQNVKGLTDGGKRGTYIFNTSKIKV